MRRGSLVALVLAIALAGCARDSTDDPQAISSPTASPEPTPCVLDDASARDRSEESEEPFSSLVDLRFDDSHGCPRVVFEFEDHVPGYEVAYVDGPFYECGSGEEVDTSDWDAEAFLSVRMEPAGGGDPDTGQPTYDGSRDIAVDGEVLKHLRRICDFEAVYEWIIGVDDEHPFDVSTPGGGAPRLVIDISQG